MRLLSIAISALTFLGCTASHGAEDSSTAPDSGGPDGSSLDACVPPPCAASPAGCYYAGGDLCSCGDLVCDTCEGPMVECPAPAPGCDYVGASPCECGTLVCSDGGVGDGGLECEDGLCPLPMPIDGCRWVPTGLACCDLRLHCDTCDERFPDFDNSCTTDEHCAVAVHQTDCCGSVVARGVNQSEFDRFNLIEGACREEAPECDCVPRPPRAEDGSIGSEFSVTCSTSGVCIASAR